MKRPARAHARGQPCERERLDVIRRDAQRRGRCDRARAHSSPSMRISVALNAPPPHTSTSTRATCCAIAVRSRLLSGAQRGLHVARRQFALRSLCDSHAD